MPKLSITCANTMLVYHCLSKWCTDRRQSIYYASTMIGTQ